MALDVKIVQHDEYLEVLVSGAYGMQDAIDRFPHVLSACRLTGASKVLIDFRELTGIPAATEKVLYAFGVRDHYEKYISTGGQPLRVAYVGKAPLVSTYEPGLQVAQDGKLPFDLFVDISEAYEWLGVDPT